MTSIVAVICTNKGLHATEHLDRIARRPEGIEPLGLRKARSPATSWSSDDDTGGADIGFMYEATPDFRVSFGGNIKWRFPRCAGCGKTWPDITNKRLTVLVDDAVAADRRVVDISEA